MPDPDLTPGPLGPCQPYCQITDICGEEEASVSEAADAIIDASEILYALLGRTIHGVCTATVQTDTECSNWSDGRTWLGGWGRYGFSYGTTFWQPRPSVVMLQSPVVSIAEVAVDGDALDPMLYVLRDGNQLAYANGDAWVGLVTITYSFGTPVPRYVRDAAVELATELFKERCGRSSCLPANATSVQRQGVSVNFDRNVERVREAGPSLPRVMAAMSVVNPMNQRSGAEVWSPDDPLRLHVVRTFPDA